MERRGTGRNLQVSAASCKFVLLGELFFWLDFCLFRSVSLDDQTVNYSASRPINDSPPASYFEHISRAVD